MPSRSDPKSKHRAIQVTENDPRGLSSLRGSFLTDFVKKALASRGIHTADLTITLIDGRAMRKLNRLSLGHDYVTDVITFDLRPSEPQRGQEPQSHMEGEIYICPAQARRNAREYGEPYERELLRYIAHGILHLSGYDDATLDQRAVMRREEDRILEAGLFNRRMRV